jgi:hypothetical protein
MPTAPTVNGRSMAWNLRTARTFLASVRLRGAKGVAFLSVLSPKLADECPTRVPIVSAAPKSLCGAPRRRKGTKMWGRALCALSEVGALLARVGFVGLFLRPPAVRWR